MHYKHFSLISITCQMNDRRPSRQAVPSSVRIFESVCSIFCNPFGHGECCAHYKKVRVKFTLEQATKAQREI